MGTTLGLRRGVRGEEVLLLVELAEAEKVVGALGEACGLLLQELHLGEFVVWARVCLWPGHLGCREGTRLWGVSDSLRRVL